VSVVGVIAEGSYDPDPSARKALDSMRMPLDRESRVIAGENTALGFVGSLSAVGKELAKAQIEGGPQIVLVATPELLRDAGFNPVDDSGDCRVSEGMLDILDMLSESAIRRRGGWSLIGAVGGRILGGRDIVGQSPLFWGSNRRFTAFASSRKALWSLGISSVNCVPEGTFVEFGKRSHRRRRIGELARPKPQSLSQDQAAAELLELLRSSVKAVVQNSKMVGVLFSGGLDSSIVAAAADDLGIETKLYTAAFEDLSGLASAERAAGLLGLNLEAEVVSLDEAEDVLRRVVWEIESSDPLQVCVGMPIEVATKIAASREERLLLSGSGADELFGGYSKYLEAYRMFGEDGVADRMFQDIVGLGRRDLLRDGAIGEANRVQLSAPFLDLELVRFGLEIPIALKLEGMGDNLRKRVLRRTARMMEIPEEIVDLPKKAAQYSSRSLAVAKKLAKGEGLSLRGYLESTFKKIFSQYCSEASTEP